MSLDPLAAYGAVVATGAIGWQVYAWRRDRETKVLVELGNAFIGIGGEPVEVALITVINLSAHKIRTNSAGLEMQDGSRNCLVQPSSRGDVPGMIDSLDSAVTWWTIDEVKQAGFDLYKPIVARVNLSTGKRLRSKRRPLRTKSAKVA